MGPVDLKHVLADYNFPADDNVLVGLDEGDDAAVYRLNESEAVVASADYITPIVDDPETYGRIAAVNSISDIYAMGAEPLFALNLVCFPTKDLPRDMLRSILAGGAEIARQAGIPVLGGHTVCDPEPKYGMVVIGRVHPDQVWLNKGLKKGHQLVLTKALGTGAVSRAIRKGRASEELVNAAVTSMTTLNRSARDVAAQGQVFACTDITGFGLLGHLTEMVSASRAKVAIDLDRLPVLPGVLPQMANKDQPEATGNNWAYGEPLIQRQGEALSLLERNLLADPQTSGGLLLALNEQDAARVVESLRSSGLPAANIGEVLADGCSPAIVVRGSRKE